MIEIAHDDAAKSKTDLDVDLLREEDNDWIGLDLIIWKEWVTLEKRM